MTLKRDLAEKITVLDAVYHYHQPIFIKGEPKHDKLVILPNLKSILITVNTFRELFERRFETERVPSYGYNWTGEIL